MDKDIDIERDRETRGTARQKDRETKVQRDKGTDRKIDS